MKYSLLIIILLAGLVSADCRASYDYCATVDLYNGDLPLVSPDNDAIGFTTSMFTEKNVNGELYAWYNLSNVHVDVVNSTNGGVGYDFDGVTNNGGGSGVCSSAFPCHFYFTRKNCTTGCSNLITAKATLCLNGTSTNYNHNFVNTVGIVGIPGDRLSIDRFTPYYRRLWTFRDDITNNIFNFSGQNATLTAWCNDYSQMTWNLSASLSDKINLTVQTLQQPKFFLSVNNLLPRVRQDSQNFLADNYYVPTSDGLNYTFSLVDYTGGQFYRSVLTISENINDSIGNVHVEQFDQSNVQYAVLRPSTQYNFRVTSSSSVRDLGAVYLAGNNLARNVVVSMPTLNPFTSRWDGLNISITSSYSGATITCVVSSVSLVDASFMLYTTNTTPYTLISVTNATSVLTSTLTANANKSMEYYGKCFTSDSTFGVRERVELINFQNTSAYYGGFGDLVLPDSIFGIEKTKFLNIMSVVVAVVVAGLFSAISMGTGAIVFGMTIGLFYMIGYFVTSPMTIGMIIFLGFMIKISENRFGVVT